MIDHTEKLYASIHGVRISELVHMAISPMHYADACHHRGGESRAMRLGRAIHCLILQEDQFHLSWVCFEGKRRQGKTWDDFEAKHADREILTQAEMNHVVQCAAAVKRHELAAQYIKGAHEEVVVWTDTETGIRCKARCDTVTTTRLAELKSGARIGAREFGALAARLGYHLQCAFHLDGLLANGHDLYVEPVIIAVESSRPYDVVVYTVPEHAMEAGRNEYRRLLRKVAECRERDAWPGRAETSVVPLTLPEWAFFDPEADMLNLTLDGEAVEI